MKTFGNLIFIALAGCVSLYGSEPQSGSLTVYGSQFNGRVTASGEVYTGKDLTAAHESLPFGTIVRVANFSSGKMADVRINDRKPRDGRALTISEGAAKQLGIPAGAMASATYQAVGRIEPPRGVQVTDDGERLNGSHRIGLFGSGKEGGNSKAVPASSYPASSYSYTPPTQVAQDPPAQKKSGGFSLSGLFGGNSDPVTPPPPAAYPTPTAYTQPLPATPSYAPSGDLVPLNAVALASTPAPEVMARPQPTSALPGQPAAAPYRAQFGAFRRSTNAYNMSGDLVRSGIGNMVVQSPATQLFLVVTSAGFSSATEAQHWIDVEASRRGWRERPVVIR